MKSRLVTPGSALVAVLMLTGCGQCGFELIEASTSPKTDKVLQLERVNCGATDGYVYNIVAYEKGDADGRHVFRFDGGNGGMHWPSPWEDEKLLDMRWSGPSRVDVILHYPVRIFDKRRSVDGVAFRYFYKPGTVRD